MILKASTRKANPVMSDPTRTGNIRQGFIVEINRKTNALKRKIWDLVVTEDAFGLKAGGTIKTPSSLVGNQRFAFRTDVEKIKGLSSWFEDQVKEGILSVDAKTGDIWAADYVASAYKQGYQRAYEDLHKSQLSKSVDFYNGSRQEFLRSAFAQPESMEKIRLLAARTFQDLKGVSQDMGTQISRFLVDGMAHGRSPQQIARDMNRAITKLTNTRARAIARTEIINAHAEGQLDSFQKLGVEKLSVMAEWSTAGDDLVCPLCHPLEGVTYTIAEARGMLPRHVNCRCAWAPANVGENPKEGRTILQPKTGQEVWSGPEIRSTSEVQKAMHDSIRAERKKGSYEEVRRRSTWKGADPLKMKKRPVAFVRAAGKGKFNVFAAPAPQLWNHQPTAVIRWMGKEGWSADDAKRVLDGMGVDVEMSTIKTQLGAGKKGLRGPVAPLTDEQRALLTAKRLGQKVEVTPKPLLPVEKLVPTPKIAPKPKVSSVYPNHRGAVVPDGIIPELQAKLDIVDVDSEMVKKLLDDLSQIPAEHQKLMAQNDYRFYVGNRAMTELDENGHLRGVRPLGWTKNTWDDVPGSCDPTRKIVTIGAGNHGAGGSVAWHECGHAIDNSLKHSAAFSEKFGDLQKMLIQVNGNYAKSSDEAFAIGYDHYLAIKTGRVIKSPTYGEVRIGNYMYSKSKADQLTSFFDDFFAAKTPTPKVVVPKVEVPKIPVSLPKVEVPKVELPKVELPKVSTTTPSFGDQKATALARWMGNENWSYAEARKAADELGLDIKDSTLRTQINAGRKGARGGAPTLTKEQSDYLNSIRGKTPTAKPVVSKIEVPKTPVSLPKVEVPKVVGIGPPKGVTFTGEADDFSRKVWAEMGTGINHESEAVKVGKLIDDEITRRLDETFGSFEEMRRKTDALFDEYQKTSADLLAKYPVMSERPVEVQAKIDAARDVWFDSSKKTSDLVKNRDRAYGDYAQQTLAKIRDMGFAPGEKLNLAGGSVREATDAINEVVKYVPTDLQRKANSLPITAKLDTRKNPRGFHRAEKDFNGRVKSRSINLRKLRSGEFQRASAVGEISETNALHEFTHAVQQSNSKVSSLEKEFLRRRVSESTGKKAVLTEIYKGSGEMGYKDKFTNHYIGKEYPGLNYGEVMTMGVEGVFYNMHGILHGDRDLVRFILGVFAGVF